MDDLVIGKVAVDAQIQSFRAPDAAHRA